MARGTNKAKDRSQYPDAFKKRVVADFVQLQNYAAVGRMHRISATTVKRYVKEFGGLTEECALKKEQNSADILQYMQGCSDKVKIVIAACLEALADPVKIQKAPLRDIATAMGIVIDKFAGITEMNLEEQKARIENLKAKTAKITGDDQEAERTDDGFLEAMQAEAKGAWEEE